MILGDGLLHADRLNNNMFLRGADHAVVEGFHVNGPKDVPGYSVYEYNAVAPQPDGKFVSAAGGDARRGSGVGQEYTWPPLHAPI